MIPAPFEYLRATSLDEALALLASDDGSTKLLAGGHSLLPLMKLRLARPPRLLDIGRLEELRGVRDAGDGLAIGALETWDALLHDPAIQRHALLVDAISGIGDAQVRNRGTIGGSVVHADPASDIAAPLLALDATLVIRSAKGERTIAYRELPVAPFLTSLAPDEILTEIRLPTAAGDTGSAYRSLPQPASGYPLAGAAVVVRRGRGGGGGRGAADGDGRFATARIAVTGVAEMPYRASRAEEALLAGAPLEDVAALAIDGVAVLGDLHADAEYRGALAQVMVRRAAEEALRRLG